MMNDVDHLRIQICPTSDNFLSSERIFILETEYNDTNVLQPTYSIPVFGQTIFYIKNVITFFSNKGLFSLNDLSMNVKNYVIGINDRIEPNLPAPSGILTKNPSTLDG